MTFDLSKLIDARLVSIVQSRSSKDVILTFSKRFSSVEVCATCIESILVSDFTEQNVVDEFIIYKGGEDRETLRARISELLFRCTAEAAVVQPTFKDKLNATLREVESGEKVFVEVVPVVGASVLLLASRLEITCLNTTEEKQEGEGKEVEAAS